MQVTGALRLLLAPKPLSLTGLTLARADWSAYFRQSAGLAPMLKDFREEREEAEPATVTAEHSAAQRSTVHHEACRGLFDETYRGRSCTCTQLYCRRWYAEGWLMPCYASLHPGAFTNCELFRNFCGPFAEFVRHFQIARARNELICALLASTWPSMLLDSYKQKQRLNMTRHSINHEDYPGGS